MSTEHEQELERVKKDLATANAVIKDDCENEVMIEKLCAPFLTELELHGDSYGVPGVTGIVENTINKLKKERDEALAKCAEMREALESFHQQFIPDAVDESMAVEQMLTHALSSDCGKGFRSPEEYAALEAKLAFWIDMAKQCATGRGPDGKYLTCDDKCAAIEAAERADS